MYLYYRDAIYKLLTNPSIDQHREQIRSLIHSKSFKCYMDYILCLEELCDILKFDFYKLSPLKTVSDREAQTKIMQILDFEFKHFTAGSVMTGKLQLVGMFKRDQPNKKIIEQLESRYQLSVKALVFFNSDQLERIKKSFERLDNYRRQVIMENEVIRLPQMSIEFDICLRSCMDRVKGELAIFADAPKQFDWRRLSAFDGSGVSFVMAAIIGGSKNFLFQFFSLLRQDNELFGNNYFKAYSRLAARCGQSEILEYLMSKCPEILITKNMVLDAAASGNEEFFIRLKQRFFENNPDADEFEKEIMMCLVLSGDMQLLERQSKYVALLQAMDINDLYLTIAYASVSNLIMLRLILTAILENNIRLEPIDGLRSLDSLMNEIIRGGASIEALEIVVNVFYPKQFWVPCTYQLRTAARTGNITVFDWVRNRNPALEIDALLLETAKRSGNPRMREHIYRSSFSPRSVP